MGIKREAVDRQQIDYSDVSTGGRLPPVHPGEILRDEFLKPMNLSVYGLARSLNVSRPRLNDIVLGRRGVTTDTALRLGRYFGMTPEFWINLQTRYDLDVAERTISSQIEQEIEPRTAAIGPTGQAS
ncbi:MAG: HigA family addiction module antitoxin [Spirochaetaceae bacterium]|nr:HigA family addiction module antitoxin [Spirochaetaceae bacterium]